MMTNPETGVLRQAAGEGLLARYGDLVLLCGSDPESDARVGLVLATVAEVADAHGDGRLLCRRLAGVLATAGLDGDDLPPLCAFGPAGDGVAAIVHGDAELAVTTGTETVQLAGHTAVTCVDRVVKGPVDRVRAAAGTMLDQTATAGWTRLDGGVVRAGAFLFLATPASSMAPSMDSSMACAMAEVSEDVMANGHAPAKANGHSPAKMNGHAMTEHTTVFERRDPAVMFGEGACDAMADPPSDIGANIYGIDCKNAHFNDPRAPFCTVCGISMNQQTHEVRLRERPSLGVLTLDDGGIVPLDGGYAIGREPTGDKGVAAGYLRPLMLSDEAGNISRTHARLLLDGWDVKLVDLGSTNGTYVSSSGRDWSRIPPHTPVALSPGTRVAVGRRGFRFDTHRNTP